MIYFGTFMIMFLALFMYVLFPKILKLIWCVFN